jgi:hypothetical protein
MGLRRSYLQFLRLIFVCLIATSSSTTIAWEWSDLVTTTTTTTTASSSFWSSSLLSSSYTRQTGTTDTTKFLSIQEVSDLRVRDIKRRLTRTHGYSHEELEAILDKKELIHKLAYEEEKHRLEHERSARREVFKSGLFAAILTALVVLCWPLFQHAYEVAAINVVVYVDRKTHEANRCLQLKSTKGMVGVLIMGILDVLSLWLSVSVLLSWVMTSKYFFPVPKLTLRPAQMMGGEVAKSNLANYGINMGAMVVTWGMRFVYGKVERFTGQALSAAQKRQRKEARHGESDEDRAARRVARRAAKLERQEREAAVAAAAPARNGPNPTQPPPDWAQRPIAGTGAQQQPVPESRAHQEFLNQVDEHISEMDDLD